VAVVVAFGSPRDSIVEQILPSLFLETRLLIEHVNDSSCSRDAGDAGSWVYIWRCKGHGGSAESRLKGQGWWRSWRPERVLGEM
jgi:hypothetical protein